MRDQSCMPVTADDAEAVITAAESITREAAADDAARARRKARQAEKKRRRDAEQERKAAGQRERDRERRAEEGRLRAEAEQARSALLRRAAALRDASGGSVRDCFEGMPGPRDPRGLRHPLPAILALVVVAMLHGKTKLCGITAWVAHAGQRDLELAGARHRGKDGLLTAPSPKTVIRVLGLVGPQPVSDAAGSYLAAAVPAAQPAEQQEREPAVRPHLQCDGKEVRGARRADGTSMFILSAATGGIVVADREIPAKTNEIPEIGPMLLSLDKRLPLAGWILTADALHTQREFAELAVTQLHAHYVLTVKKNQRNLHSALRGLCWAGARRHVTEDRGHGRAERRSHLLMDAPEEIKALFPHVRQVAKVTRTRTVRRWKGDGKNWRLVTETTTETVYLVTSLSALQATPQHVAAYIRAHWSIENQVHWVRDATLREDASKVSAANRARNLVTLRNLVTGLIRQSGRNGIAATIRDTEYEEGLLTALARFDTAL